MDIKEIKKIFSFLDINKEMLTPYQKDFIKSLKKYFTWKKTLSARQMDVLLNIRDAMFPDVMEKRHAQVQK